MSNNNIHIAAAAVAISCVILAACSTTTTQSFRHVENARVDVGYIAIGADFSKYDRLTANDMGIYYPTHAAPSEADQRKLRDIFRQAFLAQLDEYTIVQDDNGPSTLLVQASLIDFTNAEPEDAMAVGGDMRDFATPGTLIFMMELKDAASGEVLARAGDSAEMPVISTSRYAPTDWAAVESAAERWARLFREFLDRNLEQ